MAITLPTTTHLYTCTLRTPHAQGPVRAVVIAAGHAQWARALGTGYATTSVRGAFGGAHSLPPLLDLTLLREAIQFDVVIVGASCAVELRCASDAPPLVWVLENGQSSTLPATPGESTAQVALYAPPLPEAIICNARTAYDLSRQNAALRAEREHLLRTRDEQTAARAEAALRYAELEQSAREAHLFKNFIVRNVSHELKTPLLHLKGAISQLNEEQADNKLVFYAANATQRLEEVVQNIVQLSSWLYIKREPMLVSDSIELAMRSLRRSWANRDRIGRVDIRLDARQPAVMGDKNALATVLMQLIDNALKFSSKEVAVSLKARRGQLVVSVADKGIGIPPHEVSRIFDSFYQIEQEDARGFGGLGVGLAIVKLILDRHATQVKVKSEPQRGSTFSFSLPILKLSEIDAALS
jgi:two-component system phosphate regulon sensor histidine kinase PhoR